MTTEELQVLVVLLQKLDDEGIRAPRLPPEVWHGMARLVPMLTVEILVSDSEGAVLMVERQDPHWSGWHIPGGFLGCGESAADACSRVAQRELGIQIELDTIIDGFSWPEHEHPYGHVTSLICACRSEQLSAVGRYFSEIPSKLAASYHRDFVHCYRDWKRFGSVPSAA